MWLWTSVLKHKLRKLDLLVINGRRDPVLLVMYNDIEIYEGKIPEKKAEEVGAGGDDKKKEGPKSKGNKEKASLT